MDAERYYIRQGGRSVQGPFDLARIRTWIAEGRVRADMEFSLDTDTWMPGSAIPALFPAGAPAPGPVPVVPVAPVAPAVPVAPVAPVAPAAPASPRLRAAPAVRATPARAPGPSSRARRSAAAPPGPPQTGRVTALGLAAVLLVGALVVDTYRTWGVEVDRPGARGVSATLTYGLRSLTAENRGRGATGAVTESYGAMAKKGEGDRSVVGETVRRSDTLGLLTLIATVLAILTLGVAALAPTFTAGHPTMGTRLALVALIPTVACAGAGLGLWLTVGNIDRIFGGGVTLDAPGVKAGSALGLSLWLHIAATIAALVGALTGRTPGGARGYGAGRYDADEADPPPRRPARRRRR